MKDEELFKSMYLDKDILIKDISEKFSIKPRQVYRKAKEFGLKIRSEKKYIKPELNEKFNRLKFIEETIGCNNRKYWKCECECGKIKDFPYFGVMSGKTKSCGCFQKERAKSRLWKGYGDISSRYWSSLKLGAKQRNYEFDITIEYGWDLFLKQNRRCALSGLEIEFSKKYQTASLDRIDNSLGYVEGNVQWLDKEVNFIKHSLSTEKLIGLCCLIADKYKKEKQNE